MLFNKSLLILGSLVGVSALGGYFGASALDSHFSQQSESPENQESLNQLQEGASRSLENDASEDDSRDNGQIRETGDGLPAVGNSEGQQINSVSSDPGGSVNNSPTEEGTVSEQGSKSKITNDNESSGSVVKGSPVSSTSIGSLPSGSIGEDPIDSDRSTSETVQKITVSVSEKSPTQDSEIQGERGTDQSEVKTQSSSQPQTTETTAISSNSGESQSVDVSAGQSE